MSNPYSMWPAIGLAGTTKGFLGKLRIDGVGNDGYNTPLRDTDRAHVILETNPLWFYFDADGVDAADTTTHPYVVRPVDFATYGQGVWKETTDHILLESDVGDTPVNGATGVPISSNWAFDHVAAADPHAVYVLESMFTGDGGILVGTGAGTFAEETGATLRTSIGVGTGDTPQFTGLTLSEYIDLTEMATPANPDTDKLRVYAVEDDDFTVLETITDLGVINRINQDTFRIARNTSGGSLAKGTVVRYTGSTGNKPNFSAAQANAVGTMPAVGILGTAVDDNTFGEVMIVGRITGIKTDYTNAGEPTYAPVADWAEGNELYVNSAVLGGLQNSKPAHPNFSQWIATIETVHATEGIILVKTQAMLGLEDGTNSGTFTVGSAGTGEVIADSLNSVAGPLTIEIGGVAQQTITATETTFAGNIVVPDAATLGNATTADLFSFDAAETVFNKSGADVNLRVEGTGDTNLIFVDAGNDKIGYGTNAPDSKLHVKDPVSWNASGIFHSTQSVVDGPHFSLRHQRGAGIHAANDYYGSLSFQGLKSDSSGWWDAATIVAVNTGAATYPIGELWFRTRAAAGMGTRMVITDSGLIGINEADPETRVEISAWEAYLTLHNTAHENTLNGRETRFNFKGEKTDTTETTMGRIEVAHDSALDDYLSHMKFYVNAGGGADTIVEALRLDSALMATFAGDITMSDAKNFILNATTGTKIGTATNQKIGFWNTAPVSQLLKADYNNWAALGDVVNALVAVGLFDQA